MLLLYFTVVHFHQIEVRVGEKNVLKLLTEYCGYSSVRSEMDNLFWYLRYDSHLQFKIKIITVIFPFPFESNTP